MPVIKSLQNKNLSCNQSAGWYNFLVYRYLPNPVVLSFTSANKLCLLWDYIDRKRQIIQKTVKKIETRTV